MYSHSYYRFHTMRKLLVRITNLISGFLSSGCLKDPLILPGCKGTLRFICSIFLSVERGISMNSINWNISMHFLAGSCISQCFITELIPGLPSWCRDLRPRAILGPVLPGHTQGVGWEAENLELKLVPYWMPVLQVDDCLATAAHQSLCVRVCMLFHEMGNTDKAVTIKQAEVSYLNSWSLGGSQWSDHQPVGYGSS